VLVSPAHWDGQWVERESLVVGGSRSESELDRRVVAVAVGLSPPICLTSDDFDAHSVDGGSVLGLAVYQASPTDPDLWFMMSCEAVLRRAEV
jgi:hypothetical protein